MKAYALLATMAMAPVSGLLISACGSTVRNEGGQPHADGGPSSGGAGSGGISGAGGTRVILGTGGTPVLSDAGGFGVLSAGTPLGKACLADRDCGATLKCIPSTSADFIGGGPPNGFCTLDCTSDFDALGDAGVGICRREIAPDAICLGVSPSPILKGRAFCVPPCSIGIGTTTKCQNRSDLACTPANPGTPDPNGYCSPRCRNDGDCGTRKCDLLNGVCVDAGAASGLPVGAGCIGSGDDPCAGFCFPFDVTSDAGQHGPGFCSAPCTLGVVGCGASGANPTAACLFGNSAAAAGDEGACAPLCDCNDGCVKGLLCRPFTSAAERTAYGRKGYCGDPIDSQTGAAATNIACPVMDAGSGRVVDAGASLDATTSSNPTGDAH